MSAAAPQMMGRAACFAEPEARGAAREARLRVRAAAAGGRTLLRVSGALAAAAAPILEAALRPYRQGRQRLILDLRSVEYIETPGLRLLLALLEELPARGGDLWLAVQPHSRVARTLSLIGMEKRCPIVATVREAWAGRRAGAGSAGAVRKESEAGHDAR